MFRSLYSVILMPQICLNQLATSVSLKLNAVIAAMKLKDAYSLEEKLDEPSYHIKEQRDYFANKGPFSQSYGFSSSRVWMWELNYKESCYC